MKKIILNLLFILALFLLSFSFSHACQPCSEELNFSETAKEADLIVIGEKACEGPSTVSDNFAGGPEWTEIKVLEVLKGDLSKNPITVKSWYGMCAYGIILKDSNPHVIFLKKGKGQYYPINGGCAIKDFQTQGETIYYIEDNNSKNTQKISVDELIKKIGSEGKRQKIDQSKNNTYKDYKVLIIFGAAIGLLIFVISIIFLSRQNKKSNQKERK